MCLNHARPPWAGLDREHGVSATGAAALSCTELEHQTEPRGPRARGHGAGRAPPLPPGTASRPAPKLRYHPLSLPELPRLPRGAGWGVGGGVTFTVKFNGGAVYQAGAPGTEVDGTTLQHSWLAGVGLGSSHQHADPVEAKGEAVQRDSSLFSSLPRPLGQGLAGGGVDAPWAVFISQKMPQMPEAQAGVRRSPCAAVTNTTPPPPTFLCY